MTQLSSLLSLSLSLFLHPFMVNISPLLSLSALLFCPAHEEDVRCACQPQQDLCINQ